MSASNDPLGYYKLFGLQPGASIADVKKAYNKFIALYHPSGAKWHAYLNSDEYKKLSEEQKKAKQDEANNKAAEANKAFKVIGDPTKKKEYDEGTGEFGQQFGGFDMGGMGGFNMGGFDIFDIFDGFKGFSKGGSKQRPDVNTDIVCKLEITLADVFHGKKSKFRVSRNKLCKGCSGHGYLDVSTCSECKGNGSVYVTAQTGFSQIKYKAECERCQGRGQVRSGRICQECKASKIYNEATIIEVNIPKGHQDGQPIVFTGMGNEHPDYETGDLIFEVKVKQQPGFSRVADHLVATVDIDIVTFVAGGEVYFSHPNGKTLSITVPPFTDPKADIMVPGQGFHNEKSKVPGDLYLTPKLVSNSGPINKDALRAVLQSSIPKPNVTDLVNLKGSHKKAPQYKNSESSGDSSRRGGFSGFSHFSDMFGRG